MDVNPKTPKKLDLALGASALMVGTGFIIAPQRQTESTAYSILQGANSMGYPEVSITDCIIDGTRCYILPTVIVEK